MNCLIVGQGIAGTVLAWTLMRRGASVQVADAGFPHQSSGLAAGIINPVTGKRYVKTWRFDDFFPVARQTYRDMEASLGCSIWQERPILRLLRDPREINDWATRVAAADYADLLGERASAGAWAPFLKPGFHLGEIRQAARVDFSTLLRAFRQKLEQDGLLLPEQINPARALEAAAHFDYVIFCEGYRGQENPFFPGLPWQLSKGEGFIFRFDAPEAQHLVEMVKRECILVPLGNGLFWAGATYDWDVEDNGPTAIGFNTLMERVQAMLAVPVRVVSHFGAIRPTVKDRRPFLGMSPLHPKMVIFNGLGTKGALLTPWWAERLVNRLLKLEKLDPETDVARYF